MKLVLEIFVKVFDGFLLTSVVTLVMGLSSGLPNLSNVWLNRVAGTAKCTP